MSANDTEAEQFVGELYHDDDGHEVWRIKDKDTGQVLREGIASDSEYRWLLDAFNHGDDHADAQERTRQGGDDIAQEPA